MRCIIKGTVIRGNGRGRELGYPTANLDVDKIVVDEGIYAATAVINGQKYPVALFIGKREMFNDPKISVEAHILDFNDDIYDQNLEIKVGNFIRPNQTFSSIDELKAQIALDCQKVREDYAKNKGVKNE